MRSRTVWRASLALPLVAPPLVAAVLTPVLLFLDADTTAFLLWHDVLAALLFVGPAYLLFAAAVLVWSLGRRTSTLRAASWLTPPLFLLVLLWGWPLVDQLLQRPLSGPELPRFDPDELVLFERLVLGIGYLFVLLAHGLHAWVRRRGWMDPPEGHLDAPLQDAVRRASRRPLQVAGLTLLAVGAVLLVLGGTGEAPALMIWAAVTVGALLLFLGSRRVSPS